MSLIAFKTEFNHSYLVVDNKTDSNESYLLKMLLNNRIENLLNCKENFLEDMSQLYFDITNKKSLSKEFETKTMTFEEINCLFEQLSQTLTNVNSYLLIQDYFLLDPQYMFLDIETKDLYLLYIPFKLKEETNLFIETRSVSKYYKLADFILEKTNHKDEHAVNIAYQFYKMSKEEFFCISSFTSYIEKEKAMKNSIMNKHSVNEEIHSKEVIIQDKTEPQVKNLNIKIWLLPICLGVFSVISFFFYLVIKEITLYACYLIFISIILALLSIFKCIYNIIFIYKIHTDKQIELSIKSSMESASVDDYWNNNEQTVFFDEYQNQIISEYTLNWIESGKRKSFILNQYPTIIGKLEGEVDCLLNDYSISRIHAKIIKKDNVVKLQDLDSTNGTFVNSVRIYPGEEITIQRKDEIQFGKLIVTVV